MSQIARTEDSQSVQVLRPTQAEWDAGVAHALARLGISYEELARQARDRDFQSAEALSLWVVIGDSRV
jgi:hypothetical protein